MTDTYEDPVLDYDQVDRAYDGLSPATRITSIAVARYHRAGEVGGVTWRPNR